MTLNPPLHLDAKYDNPMKKLNSFVLLCVFLLLPFSTAAQTALQEKLKEITQITKVNPLESAEFAEKYVTYFTQPLDHKHPEKGSFSQRVVVSHVGFDRPTVIVTEGYGAAYALYPKYREELSRMFNTNMIFVEYRYFLESTPEPRDWQYLTAENSADDLHAVRNAFKNIYPGKWIATGISKGGQTAMLYRTFYPNDVDITVPYVGPLCYGVEDGRHEPFLHQVGTAEERQKIEDFQLEVLKRKATLLPRFEKHSMITRFWNIPLLSGNGVLQSAPFRLAMPPTMKSTNTSWPSANRLTLPKAVETSHSLSKPPANLVITDTTSSRSRNTFPSNRAKAT